MASVGDGEYDKRVTVVGAGIAGLVAAYELERLGCTVEVLEASRRIGGRIFTYRFGSDIESPFVELGAMRIPASHRHTMHYIDRLGLSPDLRPFDSLLAEPNAFVHTAGGYQRLSDAARAMVEELRRACEPVSYPDDVLLFGAWLAIIVDAIAPPGQRSALRNDLRHRLLDLAVGIDLRPYRGEQDRMDLHTLFAAHPQLRTGCHEPLRSFLDDILAETSTDLLRIRGGMDRLVHRMARRITGPIVCGREVIGFEVAPERVSMLVREGRHIVTRHSRYALCTVPFSIVRAMRLVGFSPEKLDVINQIRYVPATKVALHCREPFWQKIGIHAGASSSGGRVRQTYYPPVEGDPALGAVLLASYNIDADADVLGRLSAAARYAAVLADLGTMHPELLQPGMVHNATSLAWGQYNWSRGGCAVRWGADAQASEAERAQASRPEHTLFFAGEHCSATPAWIDGAIESAMSAVGQIARRIFDAALPVPAGAALTAVGMAVR
ncbi:monoamine oxidase [Krasilnikovia cinnamomea]|uniref:Monoamine oxidase n=1 Tax=Krasilnikovia cinnamomea TaxID=349313 RepID=A0A4Q7ZQC9_9ACTN|nr:NAD(P)/FAD-dependent oxidoreductase [Krasilnikovia cinnamomea]RZU53307.1 monoamine oxidase [Krasilnikovia cinnamomea]